MTAEDRTDAVERRAGEGHDGDPIRVFDPIDRNRDEHHRGIELLRSSGRREPVEDLPPSLLDPLRPTAQDVAEPDLTGSDAAGSDAARSDAAGSDTHQ